MVNYKYAALKFLFRSQNLIPQFFDPSNQENLVRLRKNVDQFLGFKRMPSTLFRRSYNVDGIYAEMICSPRCHKGRVILFFHGGGYSFGSCNSHQALVANLVEATDVNTFIFQYGLAPEQPFPQGLEDALRIYKWLVSEQGYKPEQIIFAGDSAGGGLLLATMMSLRDRGKALPRASVCLSPWTDLLSSGASYKNNAKHDLLVKLPMLKALAGLYVNENLYAADNPLISPLYGDFHGLPPLLIQVGSSEVLLDDSVLVAQKAKEQGVEVTLEVWDHMIHVWHLFAHILPEGEQAILNIAHFVRQHLKLPLQANDVVQANDFNFTLDSLSKV